MPFIKSKVSVPLSKEQETELKTRLGQAIELVPGKSEEYLLLELEDNCRLWLRGSNAQPIAYTEAAIFCAEGHEGHPAFSEEVTRIYEEVLGVTPSNYYIKYEDIASWSVGGRFVDRRMF